VCGLMSVRLPKRTTAAKSEAPDALHQRLCSDCDRCFAFYDAVVTSTKDEAVMLEAQKLSESMLERIGLLPDIARRENC
jgi:hypothetical protein